LPQAGLGANLPEDAIYPLNLGDETGKPLDGANKYTLYFDKASVPPVNAFWSVTLYDTEGYQVLNALNRFAVSSWMPFKYNADGSLDLYFQNENPGEDKVANWPLDRHHDHDLQGRWDALTSELEAELGTIADDVATEYADALRPHQKECRRLAWEVNHLREEVRMVYAKMLADMNERAGQGILNPLFEFESEREIVEHPDPLFDSTRDYLEQIAKYKIFQGRDEAYGARQRAKRPPRRVLPMEGERISGDRRY
jgi:hypothetical protein